MTADAMSLRRQVTRNLKIVLPVYLAILAALCVPVAAKLKWGIPAEHFLRDGLSVLEAPFYIGLFSSIGVLFWCSTAAVCFFSAAVLRRTSRELYSFWMCAGGFTLAVLLDDLFLFHEIVYPQYLRVPEQAVYALYGIALLAFLTRFRKTILRSDYLVVLQALIFFGASLLVDLLDRVLELRGFYIVEDGLKLFGIVSWFLYFTRTGYDQILTFEPAAKIKSSEILEARRTPLAPLHPPLSLENSVARRSNQSRSVKRPSRT